MEDDALVLYLEKDKEVALIIEVFLLHNWNKFRNIYRCYFTDY